MYDCIDSLSSHEACESDGDRRNATVWQCNQFLCVLPLSILLIFSKQLQSDEIVQLYDSSGIRTTKSYNVSFVNHNQRTPSNYTVKLFKDIDVKSIKESTHLISTETKAIAPLDRKEIFYNASLALFPEYQSKKSMKTVDTEPINSHLSMMYEPKVTEQNPELGWHHIMLHTIRGVLGLLFDVSMLKSPELFIFTMSSFCYVFILYVPYMFISSKFFLNLI